MIDAANMWSQWVIWLLALSGFAYVYGNNPCDTAAANACYYDLVHYESLAFPLYGQNDAKLDDTCGNMNMSFACVEQYFETCHESPECNEECSDLIKEIVGFIRNTGLRKLQDELCNDFSAVRQVYLENAVCLEDNADLYASCHNDSQASQHYLSTISGADGIEARCCFFHWYHDCFTNLTRDSCGENATFFVSFAIHKLIGDIADQLCAGVPSTCTRPPLPPDEMDKDMPDESENEIPDSWDKVYNHASTLKSYTINFIVLSYLYTLLTKYIL